jgi:hypothetical protein
VRTSSSTTRRIDLHELLALVDRGCPPEFALSIVCPFDEDGRKV